MSVNNDLNASNRMTDYINESNNNTLGDLANAASNNQPTNSALEKRKIQPLESSNNNIPNRSVKQKTDNNTSNSANNPVRPVNVMNQQNYLNSNNNVNPSNNFLLFPPPARPALQNNNNANQGTQNNVQLNSYRGIIACSKEKDRGLAGNLHEIVSEVAYQSIWKGDGCLVSGHDHIHFKVDKGCVHEFEGEQHDNNGDIYIGQLARANNRLVACGQGVAKLSDGFVVAGEFRYTCLFNGKSFYNGKTPRPDFPDREHFVGNKKNGKWDGVCEVLGPYWRIIGEPSDRGTMYGKKYYKSPNSVQEGEFDGQHLDIINGSETYLGEMPPKRVVFIHKFENRNVIQTRAILPNGDHVANVIQCDDFYVGYKENSLDERYGVVAGKLEGRCVKFELFRNKVLTQDGLFKDGEWKGGTIYLPDGTIAVTPVQ